MTIPMDAYTVAQLQSALIIIEQLDPTSPACVILRDTVEERTSVKVGNGVRVSVCPTPGCGGNMVYWPQSSRAAGVPIIGCLSCRYSTIGTIEGGGDAN